MLDEDGRRYSSNVVVLIASIVVGIGGTAIYCAAEQIATGSETTVLMVLMSLASWMCSMLGYDKIKQLIEQIGEIGGK